MGVTGFFPFLTKCGYQPVQSFFIKADHKLIVDVKNIMYRFGYTVKIDDPDFAQSVATLITKTFQGFEHVVFVNDGAIDEKHAKYSTVCKRAIQRKEAEHRNLKRKLELINKDEIDEKKLEKIDRADRAARGVSLEQSKEILKLLAQNEHFTCVQCEGEADDYIIKNHHKFDFVVSEDSDFLIGGVSALLRGFCSKKQSIYRTEDILSVLKLSLRQLQELAAMAGNDYTDGGIRGMGLQKAYTLLMKYGSVRKMLADWTPVENRYFLVPSSFYQAFNQSMLMYSSKNVEFCIEEPVKTQEQPQQTQQIEKNIEKNIQISEKQKQQSSFFDFFIKKQKT